MYPTRVQLERDWLYVSMGGQIRRHRRRRRQRKQKSGTADSCWLEAQHDIRAEIGNATADSDVLCFRRRDGVVFGGRANGRLVFSVDTADGQRFVDGVVRYGEDGDGNDDVGAGSAVMAVDMREDLYASAGQKRLTLWKRTECDDVDDDNENDQRPMLEALVDFDVEYRAVAFANANDWLACGMYRDRERNALELIHLERNVRQTLNSRTTSVYDVRWLDANTIVTANYDASCRLHDLRANYDVQTWWDPYDAAVYTLELDGAFGVVTGMSANCRVNLYDIRQPGDFVQMYYPRLVRGYRGSPVYGVACDETQLFAATDHDVRCMDFSEPWPKERNYRGLFSMVIRV